MGFHSSLANRESGVCVARCADGDREATIYAGMGEYERSAWGGRVIFLVAASLFNAGVWWGLSALFFGSAWSVPVLAITFAIWLLTLFALALGVVASDR